MDPRTPVMRSCPTLFLLHGNGQVIYGRTLLEARRALASLDGTGKHLPDPDLLLQPLQGREAQLSSQLEDTFTDPQQQILFQDDPKYPTSKHDPANAYREVFNYRRALLSRREGD